jgi:hypothetical protein
MGYLPRVNRRFLNSGMYTFGICPILLMLGKTTRTSNAIFRNLAGGLPVAFVFELWPDNFAPFRPTILCPSRRMDVGIPDHLFAPFLFQVSSLPRMVP